MRKIKISLLVLIILLSGLLCKSLKGYSKGIILADNQELIKIFRPDDQQLVDKLLADLVDYDQVILHLGAKDVFKRGNAFFYRTSQNNFRYFARRLKERDQDLYLWFLDSFGGPSFLDIYREYQQIIDANYKGLKDLNLPYQGIVIDLEWINLNSKDNSKRYLELIDYLNEKFSDKDIYAFTSLVDDSEENKRRGYHEEKLKLSLDNLIMMLYIGDGGYYLEDGKLKLYLTANRVDDLRKYYQQQDYGITVAVVGRIILERNGNLYFIKSANQFDYLDQVELRYQSEQKYVKISGYKPKKTFKLQRNDGVVEKINLDDRLHFIEIKQERLVQESDLLWEYFLLKE